MVVNLQAKAIGEPQARHFEAQTWFQTWEALAGPHVDVYLGGMKHNQQDSGSTLKHNSCVAKTAIASKKDEAQRVAAAYM